MDAFTWEELYFNQRAFQKKMDILIYGNYFEDGCGNRIHPLSVKIYTKSQYLVKRLLRFYKKSTTP